MGRVTLSLLVLCLIFATVGISGAELGQKLEEDEVPDLPEESDRPEPQPHEEPQDHGEEDAEMGFLPVQREFAEYPGTGQVICDGPQCGYRRATLPGSRGFKDSYFPVSEIRRDKELIARMIDRLGAPCTSQACKAAKLKTVEGLLDKVDLIRKDNKAALEDDQQKPKGNREYKNPQASSGTLEAPASSFMDVNELHCSVSMRTRTTCSMCGGPKAFRFKGYQVEMISPREQRFIPFYPFGNRREQEVARRILKMLAPDSISTISLANNGELTCLSSSPPSMVYKTLEALGLDPNSLQLMRGLYTVEQLKWTPVLAVRVNNVGQSDIKLPETGFGRVTTRPDDENVQSVTVMWAESRTAWEKATEIVPFLALHDTVGALQIRYHGDLLDGHPGNEIHQYINGSMMFDRFDVPVLATQQQGSLFGTVKGSSPGPLSIADILFGFGCTDKRLVESTLSNCDPLPEVPIAHNLRSLHYDKTTLTSVNVDTSYSTAGGVRFGGGGEVRYKLTGVPSVLDSCDATVLAGFSPVGNTATAKMHFVWMLAPRISAGYTATKLLHLVTGRHPAPLLASFQLGDLALVMSKNKVSIAESSFLLPMLSAVEKGVSLRAVLTHSSESKIDKFLTRLLGDNSRVQLQGPISMKESSLLGNSGDLHLSKGVKMVQPMLRITVRMDGGDGSSPCVPTSECETPPDFEMGFQGMLLLPVSSFESLRMDGYLGVATMGNADGKLVASLPNSIHSLFGVPTMHLSFLVLSQPIYGAKVSQFITEGVVSFGAACSSDNMKIPGDCLQGQVLMGFDTTHPQQNMMAGRLPQVDVCFLLRFVGLRASSWQSNRLNLATASLPWGATATYGLVDHYFNVPKDEGASPTMYAVPRGFSGQGLMNFLNTNVSTQWRSNLHDGTFNLMGVLSHLKVGDTILEREKGSTEGPLLKMDASVNSQRTNIWLQGFLTAGTFQNFMLFRVDDDKIVGRGVGRFGGGVHTRLQLSSSIHHRDLSRLAWNVKGQLTPMGIEEMMKKLPAAIKGICRIDTLYCNGRRETEVLRDGWFQVCSASFGWRISGDDETTPENTMTTLKALVYGRDRTLAFKMPLNDHDAAVAAMAQSLYSALMGSAYYEHIIPSYSCQGPAPPRLFELPMLARTLSSAELPSAEMLRAAIEQDNADVAKQTLDPEVWAQTSKAMGAERSRVMLKVWQSEKDAWDYDESVRTAANPDHQPVKFAPPKPSSSVVQLGVPKTQGFGGPDSEAEGQVLPMTWRQHIPGNHYLVRQRLSGIKKRLETVRKAAQTSSIASFTKKLEATKDKLEVGMERSEDFADKLKQAREKLVREKAEMAERPTGKQIHSYAPRGEKTRTRGSRGRQSHRVAEERVSRERSSPAEVDRLKTQLKTAEAEQAALRRLDKFAQTVQRASHSVEPDHA